MNRKMKSLSGRDITRTIFTRFFVTLMVFTLGLFLFIWLGILFFSSFTWYGTESIYRFILRPISENFPLSVLVSWLVGFFVIFLFSWRKMLGYIDAVAGASEMLTSQNEDPIRLPPELKRVEDYMNRVKLDAVRSARLAKEAEQRKNDLVVYLAHDLKTPLTSVIGYLTLLRDEGQISEELRSKYLSISLDKAQRLEDLINEFFEITRFSLSKLTLEPSRVNLTRMLQQVTFEFGPLFAEKNLTCSLRAPADIEIKCDVDKMERVFDNLLRNAVNYSFPDSEITVSVEQKLGYTYIRFANRGNTIPREKLGRIFEQFYRLDTARSSKTGGAGLGLAIAKEIMELHGGAIAAFSENETVEFTVCLPLLP